MSTIHLSKDGIRYTNNYNPNCDEYVDEMVDSLVPHLRCEVTLSDDFTLEDLFKILEKNLKSYDIIFNSELGHYPLESYIKDINKDVERTTGVDYLEVYWTCGFDDYPARGYKEWQKEINLSAEFHGWGTYDYDEHSPFPEGHKGGIAIEFTPLAELKYLPIKIKNSTKVYLDDGTYVKDEDGATSLKVLFEGDKYFSVYEFVSAILYEISFMGSPDDRDKALEDLNETHTKVKEELDSGNMENFKSFVELMEDLTKEE